MSDTPSSAASGMGADYERIWLEPMAPVYGCEGRQWCQDKVWPDCDGDPEPTEYIRADLHRQALSAKDRELAEARAFARKLSDALLKVRPLGGSELFTRVGDVFYADPAYCGGEIDRLRAELHAAKAENIKIKQEKFATTTARDEALSALREKEEALRACHSFLSKQTPNNDALLDMIDAVLAQRGE